MSDYFGDIRLGDTTDVKFTTRQISGAPSTLGSSPVISAYPGNSTTELTAGITLTVDFDSRTGYNNIRVVATSGNGYATATNYDLAITTGTVNSVSVVGESVAAFSIENRSALMPATAARTLVVDAAGLADANTVKLGPTGSGTAQTAKDVGGAVPAVAAGAAGGLVISGNNSGTTQFGNLTVAGLTTLTGNVSLGGTLAVTGATTFTGAVSATNGSNDVRGVKLASGQGTITMDITGNLSGSAGSIGAGGITASSFAAGAIDNAAIATDAIGSAELAASAVTEIQTGLSTLDAAGVRTAIGLASANLDTQLAAIAGYIDTEVASILTAVNAVKLKTDNLPAAPAATSDIPTAAAITTAVLTTAMTESYAADGVAPTLAQALFQLIGRNYEFAIVGDTLTVKKLDGNTTAMTFTLAPAGGPYTSITRAS